jgi:MFS family permease
MAMFSLALAFTIKIDGMTPEEGKDLSFLLKIPEIYVIGLFITLILMGRILYLSNQKPVIQAINLPETQGFVASWNQFLEVFASAIAPVLSSLILSSLGSYRTTAIICCLFGIPSILCWLLSRKFIKKDIAKVHEILHERADEIIAKNNKEKNKIPLNQEE